MVNKDAVIIGSFMLGGLFMFAMFVASIAH
jgi:hypothetical protein